MAKLLTFGLTSRGPCQKKDSRPDPFSACRGVHLVSGAVLSFLIVEPHKSEGPDRPDEPVPATRREMLDRMTLPFGLNRYDPVRNRLPCPF